MVTIKFEKYTPRMNWRHNLLIGAQLFFILLITQYSTQASGANIIKQEVKVEKEVQDKDKLTQASELFNHRHPHGYSFGVVQQNEPRLMSDFTQVDPMSTASSHHHHKKGTKGWLDMGAWTKKKGSFGWYADFPVGKG